MGPNALSKKSLWRLRPRQRTEGKGRCAHDVDRSKFRRGGLVNLQIVANESRRVPRTLAPLGPVFCRPLNRPNRECLTFHSVLSNGNQPSTTSSRYSCGGCATAMQRVYLSGSLRDCTQFAYHIVAPPKLALKCGYATLRLRHPQATRSENPGCDRLCRTVSSVVDKTRPEFPF